MHSPPEQDCRPAAAVVDNGGATAASTLTTPALTAPVIAVYSASIGSTAPGSSNAARNDSTEKDDGAVVALEGDVGGCTTKSTLREPIDMLRMSTLLGATGVELFCRIASNAATIALRLAANAGAQKAPSNTSTTRTDCALVTSAAVSVCVTVALAGYPLGDDDTVDSMGNGGVTVVRVNDGTPRDDVCTVDCEICCLVAVTPRRCLVRVPGDRVTVAVADVFPWRATDGVAVTSLVAVAVIVSLKGASVVVHEVTIVDETVGPFGDVDID